MLKGKFLVSRISIGVKINEKFVSAIKKIEEYPKLRCIRKGTEREYIIDDVADDRYFTISFSREKIVFQIFSLELPQYYMRDGLLMLLSILAFLKDYYSADFKDIYPYIIGVLSSDRIASIFERMEMFQVEGRETDIILAKRINVLYNENKRLGMDISKIKSSSISLLSKYIHEKYRDKLRIETIADETGFNREDVFSAIKKLEDSGYKKILLKDGNYSLVRT